MRLIDVFARDTIPQYTFVFDEQTDLGNHYAMEMGADGWPWGWTSVPFSVDGENEHLGRRIGNLDLYHQLGEKVLELFADRLSINWPVRDE